MIAWSLLLLCSVSIGVFSLKFTHLELVAKVVLELADINILVSPAAIDFSLAQIYLGSGGETEPALKEVLGTQGAKKKEVVKAFRQKYTELKVFSRLYAINGTPLCQCYRNLSRKSLNVDVEFLDKTVEGISKINQWVSSKTKGKVAELIDSPMFNDGTKIFMVNAVNFEGSWELPVQKTLPRKFYMPDQNRSVSVEMMEIPGQFKYNFQKTLDAHVALLPYRKSNLSMALVVPKTFKGIRTVENKLRYLDLVNLSPKQIHVSLPKFKIKYDQDMAQALTDLGIKGIFNDTFLQSFTKPKENTRLDILQGSTSLDVDEKGTKGSAGADGEMIPAPPVKKVPKNRSNLSKENSTSPQEVDKKESNGSAGAVARSESVEVLNRSELMITCNRPFLFAIVEGTRILFFGRYSRPV
ncbi:serine protease inhibitor 42Dd-like [Drosophila ficusphila]|uniref:serine protease inhibitor 42Dd-like n=1 Tax=Drosophila ficusphila TaxID=30025 RepID=UPI0007E7AA79|nr:serine protease inhibitor 42Dd-like [Drosophila ficusphila]